MFGKRMVRGLMAVALAATMLAGTAIAQVTLPTGLASGSKYEIAFVTSDGTAATSSNIADYNRFVTAEASQNAMLGSLGVSWNAIVSTETVNASANAAFNSAIPVYNTAGQLVANAATPLYSESESLLNPIEYNQFGQLNSSTFTWTGSGLMGTKFSTVALGDANVNIGRDDYTDFHWIQGQNGWPATQTHYLYALSSPITVVPEPSSFILLGTGVFCLAGCGLRRRRRAKA